MEGGNDQILIGHGFVDGDQGVSNGFGMAEVVIDRLGAFVEIQELHFEIGCTCHRLLGKVTLKTVPNLLGSVIANGLGSWAVIWPVVEGRKRGGAGLDPSRLELAKPNEIVCLGEFDEASSIGRRIGGGGGSHERGEGRIGRQERQRGSRLISLSKFTVVMEACSRVRLMNSSGVLEWAVGDHQEQIGGIGHARDVSLNLY